LSGGQRQAIAIGRAVHEGRSILILDEPTAALGVREAHQMLTLIERLRDRGKAILIVSHNLLHVFRIADRITVLRGGQVVGTRRKADTNADEIVKMITGANML
jgi:ABC-type sugar transport system ATPase subunit